MTVTYNCYLQKTVEILSKNEHYNAPSGPKELLPDELYQVCSIM